MFRLGERKQELSYAPPPSHSHPKRVADLRSLSTASTTNIVTHSGPRPLDRTQQQYNSQSFAQQQTRGSSTNGTRSFLHTASATQRFATQNDSICLGESQRFLSSLPNPSTAPCSLTGAFAQRVLAPSSQLPYSLLTATSNSNSQLRCSASGTQHLSARPVPMSHTQDHYSTLRRCQEVQAAAGILTRSVSEASAFLCQHVEEAIARQAEQKTNQVGAFSGLTQNLEEQMALLADAMTSLKKVKAQKIACMREALIRRNSAKKSKLEVKRDGALCCKEAVRSAGPSSSRLPPVAVGGDITFGSEPFSGRSARRILVASQPQQVQQRVRATYQTQESKIHSIDAPYAFGSRTQDLPTLQSLLRPSPFFSSTDSCVDMGTTRQHQQQQPSLPTPVSSYSTPFRRTGAPTPLKDLKAIAADDDTDDDDDFFR